MAFDFDPLKSKILAFSNEVRTVLWSLPPRVADAELALKAAVQAFEVDLAHEARELDNDIAGFEEDAYLATEELAKYKQALTVLAQAAKTAKTLAEYRAIIAEAVAVL